MIYWYGRIVGRDNRISSARERLMFSELFPTAKRQNWRKEYDQVRKELAANGIDVTVDNRSEKIGYKIRDARLSKVPYMLVVGQQEEEQGLVSVRSRFAGNEGQKSIEEFTDAICKEIRTKEIRVELPEDEKKK